MLAPLEGTSAEHKVGAKIFRNAELVFQFQTAMRFTDETLIQILETMRTPGGRKLSHAQWQALLNTVRSAEQSADVSAVRPDESNYYHVCYCWSVITMAAFMLARVSAQRAGQTLFYAQAVDQALTLIQRASKEEFYEEVLKIPSLSSTKRLPAVVLWHHGMRMKFSTTLQQPFAVQDVECTVVGFEPADNDYDTMAVLDAQHCQGEHVCAFMPKAIYVNIDDCDHHFLPPAPCPVHRLDRSRRFLFELHQCCTTWHFCREAADTDLQILLRSGEQDQVCQRPTQAISTDASTCHAIVFDARHYSRSWNGCILVLPTEMQPNSEMAHRLCHAVSTEVAGHSHFYRSY